MCKTVQKKSSQKLKIFLHFTQYQVILVICTSLLLQVAGDQQIHTLDPDENLGKNVDEFPNSELKGVEIDAVFNSSISSDPKANLNVTITTASALTQAESDYEEANWEDGNWRRKDKSKIAQVVIYASVILIALVGILVKYFVTQYETLKAGAQMEYQQLRNVQSCH